MILIVDNYDSFTYNVVQYFGEMGADLLVKRNDEITLDAVAGLKPTHIVISPGPKAPRDAGLSCGIIERFGPTVPVLGICLGHQCIGEVYGGKVIRAPRLMHGKTSPIRHDGTGVFKGLANPFEATRYHSLIVERATLPASLVITATVDGDETEIMGLRHRDFPVHGVQFHPESILTQAGKTLLKNFLDQAV